MFFNSCQHAQCVQIAHTFNILLIWDLHAPFSRTLLLCSVIFDATMTHFCCLWITFCTFSVISSQTSKHTLSPCQCRTMESHHGRYGFLEVFSECKFTGRQNVRTLLRVFDCWLPIQKNSPFLWGFAIWGAGSLASSNGSTLRQGFGPNPATRPQQVAIPSPLKIQQQCKTNQQRQTKYLSNIVMREDY
jgi:hypothetical protein